MPPKAPIKKQLNEVDWIKKAEHFCAYQERCQQEVRQKLKSIKVPDIKAEEIIAHLISNNFINEERFAKIFAGGKFRIKKWGKTKIIRELKARDISDYSINKALKEIDEADYLVKMKEHIQKKNKDLGKISEIKKTYLLAKYLISKGYETELVWDYLKASAF